jgi:hypothetical protein
MKQLVASVLFLQFVTGTYAQIGIGTTSPVASAKLQIDATDKGFLPPRVALQGTDDASQGTPRIASPATGLLVFNTATAGSGATAVTPGFYYFSGTAWVRLIIPTDNTANVTGTVAIANGGTGQTTANTALNALLPAQTGNENKVLQTNGTNTSWTAISTPQSPVYATFSNDGYSGTGDAGSNVATGTTITLPPGKWSVQVSIKMATSSLSSSQVAWISMHFSETSAGATSADANVTLGGRFGPFLQFGMINGTVVINNQSASSKTYYLVKGAETATTTTPPIYIMSLGANVYSENSIIAYPMN